MIPTRSSIFKALGHLLVAGAMACAVASCSDPLTVDTPRKTVVDSVKKDTVVRGVPGMVVPRMIGYTVNEERQIWSSGQLADTSIIIDTMSTPPRIYLGEQIFNRPPLVGSWLNTVRVRADTTAIDGSIITLRNDLTLGSGMQIISTRFGPTPTDTLRSGDSKTSSRMVFEIDRSRRVVTGYFQFNADDYYFKNNDYTIDVALTINY